MQSLLVFLILFKFFLDMLFFLFLLLAPFVQSLLIVDLAKSTARQISASVEILTSFGLGFHRTQERSKPAFTSHEGTFELDLEDVVRVNLFICCDFLTALCESKHSIRQSSDFLRDDSSQ